MSLALDLSHASALNLANLQRIDSTIISIVSSSAFAAVYKLVAGAWERAEAEGPLFVVDRFEPACLLFLECSYDIVPIFAPARSFRSSAPRYRVVVLNRITPKNFVLDLTPTLEWQLQDRNYFTFRNKEDPAK